MVLVICSRRPEKIRNMLLRMLERTFISGIVDIRIIRSTVIRSGENPTSSARWVLGIRVGARHLGIRIQQTIGLYGFYGDGGFYVQPP